MTAALLILSGFGSVANAQTNSCDPQDRLNDQARNLRISQKPDEAQAVVNKVLNTRPDDFRANYTAALIVLDKARSDRAARQLGIQKLIKTSELLPKQDQRCALSKNFYSIYNTIGVEYFNLNDVASAKIYFLKANEHKSSLNDDTNHKLLDNLGLIMFRENNYPCANAYFKQANDANLQNAKTHFALTQKILKSAGDTTGCKKLF